MVIFTLILEYTNAEMCIQCNNSGIFLFTISKLRLCNECTRHKHLFHFLSKVSLITFWYSGSHYNAGLHRHTSHKASTTVIRFKPVLELADRFYWCSVSNFMQVCSLVLKPFHVIQMYLQNGQTEYKASMDKTNVYIPYVLYTCICFAYILTYNWLKHMYKVESPTAHLSFTKALY